jgi:hypothetical protein
VIRGEHAAKASSITRLRRRPALDHCQGGTVEARSSANAAYWGADRSPRFTPGWVLRFRS